MTAAPTIDVTNVLVGKAQIYVAPAPLQVPEPMPVDTILVGQAWAGNWIFPGATDSGLTLATDRSVVKLYVEEQSTAVKTPTDTQDITVSFTCAEETLVNMKLAFGGGTATTVAAGASQPGINQLALSDTADFLSVGFEGVNKLGFYRRFYVPVVQSTGKVSVAFRRAKAERMWDVELSAVCAVSSIVIRDMTAIATS